MNKINRDPKYIAERCRQIRDLLSWTQENLASASNLTTRTIEKVESGRHLPSEQTLELIARAIGSDVTIFSKPTPEEEKRINAEIERTMRKTVLVPTTVIRNATDFYSLNKEWHGIILDSSSIDEERALYLIASISDWLTDLDIIWGIADHSERLEYSKSVASLCSDLAKCGYDVHFGEFQQQHVNDSGFTLDIAVVKFLRTSKDNEQSYALIRLDDPWQVVRSN